MTTPKVNERIYIDSIPLRLRMGRLLWAVAYVFLFRYTPRAAFSSWRNWILRRFGAKIGVGCRIAPSCRIWAPWNLVMGDYVCLAEQVDCYAVGKVFLEDYSTVSQRAFICTATHDIGSLNRPLVVRDILIKQHAWVCAEAFLGPGVIVGEGAIVGARAVVLKSVEDWTVVAGNPAAFIKQRVLQGEPG